MGITIGILAHVDAGKTTLSEQILYHTGVLRALGRVDKKNAFLDYSAVERERGITVFSDQAVFECAGRMFSLIDTPGHVDFSGEMERCLWVMDCAVLVVSCVEGIQSHTETVWRLLRQNKVPTLIFLNKTDRAGANPEGILQKMKSDWGVCCPDFSRGFHAGEMDTALAEQLAELDDALMDTYFSTGYEKKTWLSAASRMIGECRIFPVLRGSALNGQGVEELLQVLPLLSPRVLGDESAPFSARVYKVRHDRQGGRVVFMKVTAGTLHPKDEIACEAGDGTILHEKGNELRSYSGAKFALRESAGTGDLCAVTGLLSPKPGDEIGARAGGKAPFVTQPLLAAKVLFDSEIHPKTMLQYLRELEDEEPLLGVAWDEEVQELHVHVMGEIQLEVLTEVIRERFGIAVRFGTCEILYRETILAPTIGYAHFEPLRHYAEVHLRLEPGEKGSGITFATECPTDVLSSNWQNLIRTHVLEKEHKGVLTGAPLTDVRITLLMGRAHLKHTEGGDFREATYRAVRQGLMTARSILLEPFYAFEIETEVSLTGRVLSDIQRMNGTFENQEIEGERAAVRGRAPVAAIIGYPQKLTAFTKGRGKISFTFDGYDPCCDAEEVIARKNYDPERDKANTPNSMFCSHGAGFLVKWDEAAAHMHIK